MYDTIYIHTPMELETFDYYRYMISTVNRLKSNLVNINFKAYIMGSRDKMTQEMQSFFDVNSIDLIYTEIFEISSAGHAKAINFIFENFQKNAINIISDSDVAICLNNFDTYIIDELKKNDVIGTKYENIGGPCVEVNYPRADNIYQTYKNRPNLIWCAFSNRHNFSDIRVTAPNTRDTCKLIESEQDVTIWGLPKGYMLWLEAAWEFPKYLFDRNLKYSTFIKCNPYEKTSPEGTSPRVLDDQFKAGLSFQDAIYSEEYQLKDGTPFLVHQRGSRKRKFRIDTVSKRFYNAYERFLKI